MYRTGVKKRQFLWHSCATQLNILGRLDRQFENGLLVMQFVWNQLNNWMYLLYSTNLKTLQIDRLTILMWLIFTPGTEFNCVYMLASLSWNINPRYQNCSAPLWLSCLFRFTYWCIVMTEMLLLKLLPFNEHLKLLYVSLMNLFQVKKRKPKKCILFWKDINLCGEYSL